MIARTLLPSAHSRGRHPNAKYVLMAHLIHLSTTVSYIIVRTFRCVDCASLGYPFRGRRFCTINWEKLCGHCVYLLKRTVFLEPLQLTTFKDLSPCRRVCLLNSIAVIETVKSYQIKELNGAPTIGSKRYTVACLTERRFMLMERTHEETGRQP